MAGSKLDGAGVAKMHTLEDAFSQLQRVHALVEQMGMAVRSEKPTQVFGMQIRRAATPLVGQLKAQFGMVADLVSGLILVATRGGPDKPKLRALREAVAQIRTQLELAQNKVKELHSTEEKGDDAPAA